MALKTDTTKAYNGLEWNFLEETMRRMGFCEKWISCGSCAVYQLLISHMEPECTEETFIRRDKTRWNGELIRRKVVPSRCSNHFLNVCLMTLIN